MEQRIKGQIKWFSNKKGYGFIVGPPEGREYFVHYSKIVKKTDEKVDFEEGESVKFIPFKSPRGWEAREVEKV